MLCANMTKSYWLRGSYFNTKHDYRGLFSGPMGNLNVYEGQETERVKERKTHQLQGAVEVSKIAERNVHFVRNKAYIQRLLQQLLHSLL